MRSMLADRIYALGHMNEDGERVFLPEEEDERRRFARFLALHRNEFHYPFPATLLDFDHCGGFGPEFDAIFRDALLSLRTVNREQKSMYFSL
jgi:hypothetical protein